MTGAKSIYFRCTVPYTLTNSLRYFEEKTFENAFPWNDVLDDLEPSAIMLNVRIGAAAEPDIGADFVDLATRGKKWRYPLTPMTVDKQTAGALLSSGELDSLEMDRGERAMLKASAEFEVFGMLSGQIKKLRKRSPPGPWSELLNGFKVISNSSKSYAVIVSNWLASISICIPAGVDDNSSLSAVEVRRVAFTFFSDSDKLELLTCADFLGQPEKWQL